MTRGGSDAKRRAQVLLFAWLLVASAIGAGNVVAGADARSDVLRPPSAITGTATSAVERTRATTIDENTTTAESPRPLDPAFHFACEQVAVTARGYDSVTLVFADGGRQTFHWTFRGRNVFFGTGENVGAVVEEVVVERGGQRVTRRNPSLGTCAGRTATHSSNTTNVIPSNVTTPWVVQTATTTEATATIEATPTAGTTEATETSATTATTATAGANATTATIPTLDLPTIAGTATNAAGVSATARPGTTARATARTATRVPTPTVTPRPVAGYPECADEEFGLANVLNLRSENGTFASENATTVGENRFRFSVAGETHEVELVEIERDDAGRPVSVAFDATLAVDAVVVRGGPGANVYRFPEDVTRRGGLRAPTDENTGRTFAVDEISFCDDPETPTETGDASGVFDPIGFGLELLVGRGAAAAVGVAAAGLLVVRRRRAG